MISIENSANVTKLCTRGEPKVKNLQLKKYKLAKSDKNIFFYLKISKSLQNSALNSLYNYLEEKLFVQFKFTLR